MTRVTGPRVAIGVLLKKYWRPDIALFLGAMAMGAVILAVNAITLNELRDETLRSVEASMQSQAIVLAEESDRSFKALDLALSTIADDIAHLGVTDTQRFQSRVAEYDIHELLKSKGAGLAHVDAISLVGANGKLVNISRSWPIRDVDVSERDYFQTLRSAGAPDNFISEPVQNKATGEWTIFRAHRLSAPDGSFMGLLLGAITLRHFEGYFRSIARQDGSAVALVRQDGMLLARYPHSDRIGKIIRSRTGSAIELSNLRRIESPVDEPDADPLRSRSFPHIP